MERGDQIRKLISIYKRRLWKFEEQKAIQGITADPNVEIQIEDINDNIAVLNEELEQLTLNSLSDISEFKIIDFTPKSPAFLHDTTDLDTKSTFIGRKNELNFLNKHMNRALEGKAQIVFIEGYAGGGKTTLLQAFAREMHKKNPELLIAWGRCESLDNVGMSYHPFQEVLDMFTGNIKPPLELSLITREQAERLWQNMFLFNQILLHYGLTLVDVLLSRKDILRRIESVIPLEMYDLDFLEPLKRSQPNVSEDLIGKTFFQQVTNVLSLFAKQRPLLIILDDLQWADEKSIKLLFSLARRLKKGRIFILGAYRSSVRNSEKHPLIALLSEFKQSLNDKRLDLSQTSNRDRQQFVEDVLDSEPNQLDFSFRQMLFNKTNGHPLFTIELLQMMRLRGDLIKDRQGRWIQSPELNWNYLPEKIEGVIKRRLSDLGTYFHELLTVASIEGKTFTAQIVAHTQRTDERQLLGQLSRTLAKKFRLIHSKGQLEVAGETLSCYQFNHGLFQEYLYKQLDPQECRLLHKEVGEILENLYGERSNEIASQLGYHFYKANNSFKASQYFHIAARQTTNTDDAIRYLTQALELTNKDNISQQYKLLLAREKIYDLQGKRKKQLEDLTMLLELIPALDDTKKQIAISIRQGNYFEELGDYQKALDIAETVVEYASQNFDLQVEIEAHIFLGRILWRQDEYILARAPLQHALKLAKNNSYYQNVAQSLFYIGQTYLGHYDYETARTYYLDALKIYQGINDQLGIADCLNTLGIIQYDLGYYSEAIEYNKKVLSIFLATGDRRGQIITLNNLGNNYCDLGDYALAKTHLENSLNLSIITDDRRFEALAKTNLALTYNLLKDYEYAYEYCNLALETLTEIQDRSIKGYTLYYLGCTLTGLHKFQEAVEVFEDAIVLRQDLGQDSRVLDNLAGLANLKYIQEKSFDAMEEVENILTTIDVHGIEGAEFPLVVYLTCYQVLEANQDPRADEILQTAYNLLQERSAKIDDETLRHSFLENVPAHREIVQAYEGKSDVV